MKTIAVIPLLALMIATVADAKACDKLVPNCTPANVAFDRAQKGPVHPDPLSDGPGSRERALRLPNQG